jgi:hypothetical protein
VVRFDLPVFLSLLASLHANLNLLLSLTFVIVRLAFFFLGFDFRFDESQFFIPHGDEVLERFDVLALLLFVEDAETVEILIKDGLGKFLFEFSHF